jgi:hypothetical protein
MVHLSHRRGNNESAGVVAEPMQRLVTFRDDDRGLYVRGKCKGGTSLLYAKERRVLDCASPRHMTMIMLFQ